MTSREISQAIDQIREHCGSDAMVMFVTSLSPLSFIVASADQVELPDDSSLVLVEKGVFQSQVGINQFGGLDRKWDYEFLTISPHSILFVASNDIVDDEGDGGGEEEVDDADDAPDPSAILHPSLALCLPD